MPGIVIRGLLTRHVLPAAFLLVLTGVQVTGQPSRKERSMLAKSKAFQGFSVPDLSAAKEFNGETLGVAEESLGC